METQIKVDEKVDKIIRELRDELKKSLTGFRGLYLYGSQTRNDHHKDSDIDIVLITDKHLDIGEKDRNMVWSNVRLLGYKYDVFIDLHFFTRKELEFNYAYHDEVVNKGIFYA